MLNKEETRILVIDDEERLLRILRLGLKPMGYDVRTASNGEEGLKAILSENFAVVVTDIMMPRMTGVDLIFELERLNIQLPVIVTTAYADVDTAVKSLKHGAFDYLRKPFTIEELDVVLKRALASRKQKDETAIPSLQDGIESMEKELIQKALVKSKGNKAQAARLLKISERTLWYKISKYRLE